MPRVAAPRRAAEPHSPQQRERYQAILRVAAQMGARVGIERVQMQAVAKEAGVAIATLYRYFPSKQDLFQGVLEDQVTRMESAAIPPAKDLAPAEAVARLLSSASKSLLAQPRLTAATLQANSSILTSPHASSSNTVSEAFQNAIAIASGHEITPQSQRLFRLVEQSWFGILVSALNGHLTHDEALDDISLTCSLLLSPLNAGHGHD